MNKSIKKRGAPVTVDGKRFNVYLDDQSVEKAKQIGNGNIAIKSTEMWLAWLRLNRRVQVDHTDYGLYLSNPQKSL